MLLDLARSAGVPLDQVAARIPIDPRAIERRLDLAPGTWLRAIGAPHQAHGRVARKMGDFLEPWIVENVPLTEFVSVEVLQQDDERGTVQLEVACRHCGARYMVGRANSMTLVRLGVSPNGAQYALAYSWGESKVRCPMAGPMGQGSCTDRASWWTPRRVLVHTSLDHRS